MLTTAVSSSPEHVELPTKSRASLAMVACALLAIASYALAAFAVLTKSPTADEPYHFAAAYTHVFERDFRVDPEDPPLWCWLTMAPIRRDDLRAAANSPDAHALFERILIDPTVQWAWLDKVMFESPSVDAPALINRSRLAMAALAPAIIALACAFAWKLAGPLASVAAGVLLALDPLLLGHAPLLKNDAAIALVTLLMAGALVSVMRRATVWRTLVLAGCCGLGVVVKFSGILLVVLAIAALLVRALLHAPWNVIGREARTRRSRLGVAAILVVLTLASSWLAIWASYGFRYAATADGRALDAEWFVYQMQGRAFVATHHRSPTDAEARAAPVGRLVPIALWMDRHRLLPNAYSMGLIFMHASSQSRNGFLMGEVRNTGWWYYFPLAMLFKTPTASIAAVIGALIAVLTLPALRARRWGMREEIICLIVLGGGYLLVAMSSNLNLGVRHMMPLYPLMYIGAAVVWARARSAKPRAAGWTGAVLAIALFVETIISYPNYIAFFNAPSGGSRGGVRLLGDSNLDWGQDLPVLAEWQAKHPGVRLYLSFFGSVDPAIYGIDYVNIGGGANNPSSRPPGAMDQAGVFAVSATQLQGIYVMPEAKQAYARLRNLRPREVLGGTIYLFDYPFAP
jgi:4-amino-4-deoxy-L-arabinose transferase-like glycosyltransferase